MPSKRISSFELPPGRKVGRRYVIEGRLGGGTEGEVYRVREEDTGIHRAAKLYFPQRGDQRRLAVRHAQKLNTLRGCPIVLQYHHSEIVQIRRQPVLAMISELCEGQRLEDWIDLHPGRQLGPYLALHVLYRLVRGLELVHGVGEYHSDVHTQNILIRPTGVRFELKLIDFYDWGRPARYKQRQDVVDTIRVFYDCLGGRPHYRKQAEPIRHICCGLRRSLILKRFPTMQALREHLESFKWTTLS